MQYSQSILHIFEVFNKNSVDYLVVGGSAVSYYGYNRPSINTKGVVSTVPDLDFWYAANYTNYFNLLNALEELGQDVSEYRAEQTPDPKNSFFKLTFDEYTLDLLPSLAAPLKFYVSFAKKSVLEQDGVAISFISYEDLIKDKEATGRKKDKEDISELNKVNPPDV